MVFRIASLGTESLNFNTASDNFGADNDVLIINDSYGTTGVVATYAGDDVIVLNNFSSGFSGVVVAGVGNDRVFGGNLTEVINDGHGDDHIYGAGGNDELFADRGNDLYDGGAGIDIIHFSSIDTNAPGSGVANTSAVTVDLRLTGAQNLGVFGFDTLNSIENIFGSGGGDTFFGTDGVNAIEGRGGNDFIDGRGGNDVLFAFDGQDTLIGGLGADTLILDEPGGSARDTVRYSSIQHSGTTSTTRDRINNFDRGALATDDRIDLSLIDANASLAGNQAFSFVTSFTSASGEVRVTVSGGNTLVNVDTDSDSAAEMTILVAGVTGINAGDFLL